MEYTVIHDDKVSRFEIFESGQIAFLDYKLKDDAIDLTHTIVAKQLEGQGAGSALVKYALDYANDHDLKIIPTCPFVEAYIERHKEYKDLVLV